MSLLASIPGAVSLHTTAEQRGTQQKTITPFVVKVTHNMKKYATEWPTRKELWCCCPAARVRKSIQSNASASSPRTRSRSLVTTTAGMRRRRTSSRMAHAAKRNHTAAMPSLHYLRENLCSGMMGRSTCTCRLSSARSTRTFTRSATRALRLRRGAARSASAPSIALFWRVARALVRPVRTESGAEGLRLQVCGSK